METILFNGCSFYGGCDRVTATTHMMVRRLVAFTSIICGASFYFFKQTSVSKVGRQHSQHTRPKACNAFTLDTFILSCLRLLHHHSHHTRFPERYAHLVSISCLTYKDSLIARILFSLTLGQFIEMVPVPLVYNRTNL